jgi:hypothetical protein
MDLPGASAAPSAPAPSADVRGSMAADRDHGRAVWSCGQVASAEPASLTLVVQHERDGVREGGGSGAESDRGPSGSGNP